MIPRGAQVSIHPGFVGSDRPYDCGACISHHARLYEFPEMPAGVCEDAWRLYSLLHTQQRAGGMSVLGLDYGVIPVVLDLYEVPRGKPQQTLFERLVWIDQAVGAHRAEQAELEQQKQALRRGVAH